MSKTPNFSIDASLETKLDAYLSAERLDKSDQNADPAKMIFPKKTYFRNGAPSLVLSNLYPASELFAEQNHKAALAARGMKVNLDTPAAVEADAKTDNKADVNVDDKADDSTEENAADAKADDAAPAPKVEDSLQPTRVAMVNHIAPALFNATGLIVPLQATKRGVELAKDEASLKHLHALVPFDETKVREAQVALNKMITDFVTRSYEVEAEDLESGEETSVKAEAMRELATELQNLATDFYVQHQTIGDDQFALNSAFKAFKAEFTKRVNEADELDAHRGYTRAYTHALLSLAGGLGLLTAAVDAMSVYFTNQPFFVSDTTARVDANAMVGKLAEIAEADDITEEAASEADVTVADTAAVVGDKLANAADTVKNVATDVADKIEEEATSIASPAA